MGWLRMCFVNVSWARSNHRRARSNTAGCRPERVMISTGSGSGIPCLRWASWRSCPKSKDSFAKSFRTIGISSDVGTRSAPNYQVASGFAHYGYRQIAANIAEKTVANALKNGINKHYDSMTGKPRGVPYNGMTCTVLTLMLDALSSRNTLKVKAAP